MKNNLVKILATLGLIVALALVLKGVFGVGKIGFSKISFNKNSTNSSAETILDRCYSLNDDSRIYQNFNEFVNDKDIVIESWTYLVYKNSVEERIVYKDYYIKNNSFQKTKIDKIFYPIETKSKEIVNVKPMFVQIGGQISEFKRSLVLDLGQKYVAVRTTGPNVIDNTTVKCEN